eukprot:2181777-Rhodomonas_salina.2
MMSHLARTARRGKTRPARRRLAASARQRAERRVSWALLMSASHSTTNPVHVTTLLNGYRMTSGIACTSSAANDVWLSAASPELPACVFCFRRSSPPTPSVAACFAWVWLSVSASLASASMVRCAKREAPVSGTSSGSARRKRAATCPASRLEPPTMKKSAVTLMEPPQAAPGSSETQMLWISSSVGVRGATWLDASGSMQSPGRRAR